MTGITPVVTAYCDRHPSDLHGVEGGGVMMTLPSASGDQTTRCFGRNGAGLPAMLARGSRS